MSGGRFFIFNGLDTLSVSIRYWHPGPRERFAFTFQWRSLIWLNSLCGLFFVKSYDWCLRFTLTSHSECSKDLAIKHFCFFTRSRCSDCFGFPEKLSRFGWEHFFFHRWYCILLCGRRIRTRCSEFAGSLSWWFLCWEKETGLGWIQLSQQTLFPERQGILGLKRIYSGSGCLKFYVSLFCLTTLVLIPFASSFGALSFLNSLTEGWTTLGFYLSWIRGSLLHIFLLFKTCRLFMNL